MGKKKDRKRNKALVTVPRVEPEVAAKSERRVAVHKDHMLEYPQLYLEIFITEPSQEHLFADLFSRAGCAKAKDLESADLVIFTGGADVDPALYGVTEDIHPKTRIDEKRDSRDLETYSKCLQLGIPMVGICRGAQFLHVMNGGKLIQDLDGHFGDHSIRDVKTSLYIDKTPSTHHQACLGNNRLIVVAVAWGVSKRRWINAKQFNDGGTQDIEAFFYRDTCCLGFQGHPEYKGYPRYSTWVLSKIEELIYHCPDTSYDEGKLRLKKDIREQRDNELVK